MTADYAVVVVTYNRLELLKECLKQVENQTVPAQKIIVVDNASTDGTAEYLREYKGKRQAIPDHYLCRKSGWRRGIRKRDTGVNRGNG